MKARLRENYFNILHKCPLCNSTFECCIADIEKQSMAIGYIRCPNCKHYNPIAIKEFIFRQKGV